jgi:hypothetical protein
MVNQGDDLGYHGCDGFDHGDILITMVTMVVIYLTMVTMVVMDLTMETF